MKKILLIFISVFFSLSLFAQSGDMPFNGLIVDSQGVGIARVKVAVMGSAKYTLTDKQGRFGLTNIDSDDKLILSNKAIGNIVVEISGNRSLEIKLDGKNLVAAAFSAEIEEAGMQYVKRREILPSGVVLGEDLRRTQQTDLEMALLSRVPGLMKINGVIAIRGLSSVNSSSQPLILVDGMEVSSLSAVSIQDIETVEVIKSASSYGVRGANGVISIKLRTR
ncbi:MAG: TonB-dependent receptor plug domain-containing protein [Alistipes sp.]|nr:TonB-dependent receptor plug domain-containing protein [Alistipes sp.]